MTDTKDSPRPTKFLHHSMCGTARQTEEPSQTGFSSLPSEIIAEIFKELNWRDLLNARQTCTLLYNASKTREIWGNLIRVHAAATHGPPTIFDKPMRMHNAAKLEERFLRWMKTEYTWLDEIPLNEKYIPDSSHVFLYSHLLPGGRWLICSDFGGEVLYCDLESPETGFVPLIPYPFSCQRKSMTLMAVEEDPEAEFLSFKIALVHMLFADYYVKGPHGQPEMTGDSWVDVWSGRVILDEDGQETGLQVEQLASVPITLYLGQPLFGVSLRGSLVAFTVEWHLLELMEDSWKSQGQSFNRKTVNYLTSYAGFGRKVEVMLLPGNRVLTTPSPDLCIYDHELIPWSSERPAWVDMSVPEQHSCCVAVPGSSIQRPYGFSRMFPLPENEYRVVFNTLEGIRGLILRYTESSGFSASALELLDWDDKVDCSITEFRSQLSYNCGVARFKTGRLFRARFSWPDEAGSFETGTSPILGQTNEMPLAMNAVDVAAGRLAWTAAGGGRVTMLDL